MKTLIPRSQYMDHSVSHQEYYSQFVTPAILSLVRSAIGKKNIKTSTDEHFNDIPLHRWDLLASYPVMMAASKPLKECGDGFSLSGVVCIAKAAARIIKGE
jgi:hypothetical protein